jgi:hypothetical protein
VEERQWKNDKGNGKDNDNGNNKNNRNGERGKRLDFSIDCHTLKGSQ